MIELIIHAKSHPNALTTLAHMQLRGFNSKLGIIV